MKGNLYDITLIVSLIFLSLKFYYIYPTNRLTRLPRRNGTLRAGGEDAAPEDPARAEQARLEERKRNAADPELPVISVSLKLRVFGGGFL
ncbi:hypothetical protein EAI_07643 [Harpegnathos saltator]|uniref:Uncharacterized protein n=1 Tax=Harpegnathos saltator TaxID=610380 RepID=E2B4P3_HARSA|nr:hypothetical protein EAI_07643 [Harpegnathos saltator]